jgi:hypothetical protein
VCVKVTSSTIIKTGNIKSEKGLLKKNSKGDKVKIIKLKLLRIPS